MSDDARRDAAALHSTLPAPSFGACAASEPARGWLNAIGEEVLAAIAEDYLGLLGTATSIHERDGERALGLFPAGWCAYLDQASGVEASGVSGGNDAGGRAPRTACQASCWTSSRAAIEGGAEVQERCASGIEMFAVPIRAGGRVVGAINAALGEPPRGGPELVQLAAAYGVDASALSQHAASYVAPSPEAVATAKRRLRRAADFIGEMVGRQMAERERERLFRAEAQARLRLEQLQAATAALAAALTPAEVAKGALEAGCRDGGAPRGRVVLLTANALELELVAFAGYEPAQVESWRRVRNEGGLPVVDALAQASPVVIGRRAELARRYPALADRAEETALGGIAVFPLSVGAGSARRVLGAICFDFDEDRDVAPDEVQHLETLASLTAQAMDRALAYAGERAARLEAEHANEAKASFLAVMSHELRTPLNAIAGYTELLGMGIHGPITPAQLEALGRIAFNQQHLLGHINDILDFARLEAGRMTYRIADVAMADAVTGVGPLVEPLVAAKGLSYEVAVPEDSCAVRADPERLRQVLLNLVANAAKFTDRGGHIRLEARAAAGRVELRVSDTGAGIPPEKLETIFHPFERVERPYDRPTEGAGLGLAIARDLARGMGGDLVAESALGRGSTFTVSLPRAGTA